jgi:hypothetical protein
MVSATKVSAAEAGASAEFLAEAAKYGESRPLVAGSGANAGGPKVIASSAPPLPEWAGKLDQVRSPQSTQIIDDLVVGGKAYESPGEGLAWSIKRGETQVRQMTKDQFMFMQQAGMVEGRYNNVIVLS